MTATYNAAVLRLQRAAVEAVGQLHPGADVRGSTSTKDPGQTAATSMDQTEGEAAIGGMDILSTHDIAVLDMRNALTSADRSACSVSICLARWLDCCLLARLFIGLHDCLPTSLLHFVHVL